MLIEPENWRRNICIMGFVSVFNLRINILRFYLLAEKYTKFLIFQNVLTKWMITNYMSCNLKQFPIFRNQRTIILILHLGEYHKLSKVMRQGHSDII